MRARKFCPDDVKKELNRAFPFKSVSIEELWDVLRRRFPLFFNDVERLDAFCAEIIRPESGEDTEAFWIGFSIAYENPEDGESKAAKFLEGFFPLIKERQALSVWEKDIFFSIVGWVHWQILRRLNLRL